MSDEGQYDGSGFTPGDTCPLCGQDVAPCPRCGQLTCLRCEDWAASHARWDAAGKAAR